MAKAIRFTVPQKYGVQVLHDDGTITYHFEPSNYRARMKQADVMGEVADEVGWEKILPRRYNPSKEDKANTEAAKKK